MADALGRHGYAVDAGWSGARARPGLARRLRLRSLAPHAVCQLLRRHRSRPGRRRYGAASSSPARCSASAASAGPTRCSPASMRRPTRFAVRPSRPRAASPARGATCAPSARGWLHDSRRQFGYSISTEEGFAVQVAGRNAAGRRSVPTPTRAPRSSTRARFTASLGRHIVLAARVAGAAAWGDAAARRVFSAAGSGPSYPVVRLRPRHDRPAPRFRAGGRRRARAPRSRTSISASRSRGRSAAPARGRSFCIPIHAAAFVDAGHAWTTAVPRRGPAHVDRRRALRGSRRPALRAAHDRRRRRVDARSRRRSPPRRRLRPHRLRLLVRQDQPRNSTTPNAQLIPNSQLPKPRHQVACFWTFWALGVGR